MTPAASDSLRARVYALLGNLLAAAPDAAMLEQLAGIEAFDDKVRDTLARAWAELGAAARGASAASADDEFHDLFIGLGRGELLPYASWYRAGQLHEWPLAQLRSDLQIFGIERREDVKEPEDHVAALCQTMALLSDETAGVDHGRQQAFFSAHLAPWAREFFKDLEVAASADFYRAVAKLGRAFVDLEWRYLEIGNIPAERVFKEEHIHERA